MSWRGSRDEARSRSLALFDPEAVDEYEAIVGALEPATEDAHARDLASLLAFEPGARVLDAGAGTGTMCTLLARLDGLELTALDPSPAMLERLRGKPGLERVHAVEGFCDGPEDRAHFEAERFDVIVSRQLSNGLFDPLTAFSNWHHWLAPGGAVVLLDGFYGRDSWNGASAKEVDVLPLSSNQSLALVPYLLERSGFDIERVRPLEATNALPSTRTPRYGVVARKTA